MHGADCFCCLYFCERFAGVEILGHAFDFLQQFLGPCQVIDFKRGQKLVGFLRFAVPILGWRECVLGQLTRAQSELGLIDSWDEPRVHDSVIQDACELILAIDGDKTRHWKSHLKANLKRGRMKDMQYVAVDATPERWAMWPIDAQGNEIDIEKEEGTFDEPIHRESVDP